MLWVEPILQADMLEYTNVSSAELSIVSIQPVRTGLTKTILNMILFNTLLVDAQIGMKSLERSWD